MELNGWSTLIHNQEDGCRFSLDVASSYGEIWRGHVVLGISSDVHQIHMQGTPHQENPKVGFEVGWVYSPCQPPNPIHQLHVTTSTCANNNFMILWLLVKTQKYIINFLHTVGLEPRTTWSHPRNQAQHNHLATQPLVTTSIRIKYIRPKLINLKKFHA